ncbi:uncharacterized protein LOC134820748 [Bolinopsis microptera]|uniref:uncharacterized protein LOC134820748 n=1 Tax=Bolinopsis microptera TaxID=2820187 RepID=UPI00307AEC26
MVRRSGEAGITLPPTKDWRALEQIRWSKLERDNEMFKKIQRHRYMNIIRSIQLEKSIKIKHYSRIEEKLNLKMERLAKVKQLYNIPMQESCTIHRKAKSCPLVKRERLPSLESSSRTSISTPTTHSPEIKSIKNEEPEPPVETLDDTSVKRPPSMAKLAVMVQNFLEPLCPVRSSMVGKQYQDRVRLTKSLSMQPAVKREAPQVETPSYKSKDNQAVFRQKSFYLTT